MHAAEANPSDADPVLPTVGPCKDSSLIPLPSPERSEIHLALAFCHRQLEVLAKLGEALVHLAHLADQSRQADTTDDERQELNRHFHKHARSLCHYAQTTWQGQPLFSRKDWTVDLAPNGNKLVIPGIYRSCQQARTLQQTDLLGARSATETHQRILEIVEWLTIDQALVNEIRARLGFVAHLGHAPALARPG